VGYPHLVDPRDGLTPRQRLAVDLIARGHTVRHIARELNVTERTIHNYRRKPTVMKAVLRAQEDLMTEGGSRGVSTVPEAVETLTAIMNDEDARDSDRIAASKALMNGADAYAQRKIMERKLRDLEALLRELTGADATEYLDEDADDDLNDADLDLLLPSAAIPENDT
jgi:transposase-like protein